MHSLYWTSELESTGVASVPLRENSYPLELSRVFLCRLLIVSKFHWSPRSEPIVFAFDRFIGSQLIDCGWIQKLFGTKGIDKTCRPNRGSSNHYVQVCPCFLGR